LHCRDQAGNFYGTTCSGGVHSNLGTVFKMDSNGEVTVLYSFPNGGPGSPGAGLARDRKGDLYGVTVLNPPFPISFGAVFKLPL
jgi:uncharacterized repeat protein (TIGR03803 family)